jgi:hypothetical protein
MLRMTDIHIGMMGIYRGAVKSKRTVVTQILRLTTPDLHPVDEDLSAGAPN